MLPQDSRGESRCVRPPLHTHNLLNWSPSKERKKENIAASNPGNYQVKTKSHFESGLHHTSNWDQLQCSEAIYRSSGSFDLFPAPYKSGDAPPIDRKVRPTVKQGRNQTCLAGHDFFSFPCGFFFFFFTQYCYQRKLFFLNIRMCVCGGHRKLIWT